MSCLYAHTPSGQTGNWHCLRGHLLDTADRARKFGDPLGIGDYAYVLGLFHDLGKVNPDFQNYLTNCHLGKPAMRAPHAIWGAALLYRLLQGRSDDSWKALVLPILGHHAGLADAGTAAQTLVEFLDTSPNAVERMRAFVQSLSEKLPILPPPKGPPTRRELQIRMAFSCLVDADYLDTERHFNPPKAAQRGSWPELSLLWDKLEAAQFRLIEEKKRKGDSEVNRLRRKVYDACLTASKGVRGVYRLTVPTGGGKTRSGLAFALRHALENKCSRVVVAIPYTSIIDQTAQEYRKILGENAVLEHHSALDEGDDREACDPEAVLRRLSVENWDATLVVTTTVQLFESLLGRTPSKCRKLHNLAQSVIVLDEVQTLPPELLSPTLDVLRALVEDFGVTLVLSTATQPAFEDGRFLQEFKGLQIREIVPSHSKTFDALRRVTYERRNGATTWEELAAEILNRFPDGQVMVIVNSRKDALALLAEFGEDPNAFHLSTLLCAAHRRQILKTVGARLDGERSRPLRLISTQIVEAGVDLDFPVVYRAAGPLDRIVQAAGRCNREGMLGKGGGRVVIFQPAEGGAPKGPYKVGMEKARLLLDSVPVERLDSRLHDPELYREYFRQLLDDVDTDRKRVQEYRQDLDYPEVARRYRLIPDETVPVVVPYGDGFKRLESFLQNPSRDSWRALQAYVVSPYRFDLNHLEDDGWVEAVSERLYRWLGDYDEKRGLVELVRDPADLIV